MALLGTPNDLQYRSSCASITLQYPYIYLFILEQPPLLWVPPTEEEDETSLSTRSTENEERIFCTLSVDCLSFPFSSVLGRNPFQL